MLGMRVFMVKILHDKPDARALQMSACAAMQQGVKFLRGRVQCVGEGRESSPFEEIAMADPPPRQMGRLRSHEGGGARRRGSAQPHFRLKNLLNPVL